MELSKKIGTRILFLMIGLLCLLALVLPASAAHLSDKLYTYTYTSVVYRNASAKSTVIGQMQNGTVLQVLDETNYYYQIDCYGRTGYIAKSQVKYTQQQGYIVNCFPEHPDTRSFAQFSLSNAIQNRSSILMRGNDLLGVPYVYGGITPRGFDCSGFVSYLFKNQDIVLNRCADDQMQDGLIIPREELEKGDLVFFAIEGPWVASHVGIYAGNGQMIHAGSSGICYAPLDTPYWNAYYVGARRIILEDPAVIEDMDRISTSH